MTVAANNGRVSVVIPTYNRAALLPATVASVRAQSAAARCDIVIVDDGSTDDTPAVVASLGDDIRHVRQDNAGAGAARNAGILALRNEFVAFLDSDDQWATDKIERQLAVMQRYPEVVLVAGKTQMRPPDGDVRPHVIDPPLPTDRPADFAPRLFLKCVIETPAIMVRRRALDQVGLFNTCLRRAQDYHLWCRLACFGEFYYLSDPPLATFAVAAPHSLSVDVMAQYRYVLKALDLLRPYLRRRPDLREPWRRHAAYLYGLLRNDARKHRRHADVARYTLLSLRHKPFGRNWEWRLAVDSIWRAMFTHPQRRQTASSHLLRRSAAAPPETRDSLEGIA